MANSVSVVRSSWLFEIPPLSTTRSTAKGVVVVVVVVVVEIVVVVVAAVAVAILAVIEITR